MLMLESPEPLILSQENVVDTLSSLSWANYVHV
jgi:hypothetical protein